MTVRFRIFTCLFLAAVMTVCTAWAGAEQAKEEMEQGLEEIQTLLEMAEVKETEGMSLEEMTEAVTDSTMCEYVDTATGFSMQYPSTFLFDEGENGNFAVSADRKATLYIDSVLNSGSLNEETLVEAIRLEIPDTEPRRNEQNGCLRFDRVTDGGSTGQTDLYMLTEHSLHHIILRYPSDEKETYDTYINYMINTMEASDSELG